MAFSDVVQADLDAVLSSGEFSDDVRYLAEPGSWSSTFKAFVEEGSLDDPIAIGFTAERGPQPITVTLSKTNVPLARKRDKVEWQGREYAVKAILDEDAGAWKVYCVQ